MADGAGKIATTTEGQRSVSGSIGNATRWLFQTRNGLLALWLIAAVLLLAGGGYTLYSSHVALNTERLSYIAIASTLAWLPLLLLLC